MHETHNSQNNGSDLKNPLRYATVRGMSRTCSKTRRARAVLLRARGASYEDIAQLLGYSSRKGAHSSVNSCYVKTKTSYKRPRCACGKYTLSYKVHQCEAVNLG